MCYLSARTTFSSKYHCWSYNHLSAYCPLDASRWTVKGWMDICCTLHGHVDKWGEDCWNDKHLQHISHCWDAVIQYCDWKAGVLQEVQVCCLHSYPAWDRELWWGTCDHTDWWASSRPLTLQSFWLVNNNSWWQFNWFETLVDIWWWW